MELNNKKVINAWCMYDWANSVYSLVITSTIFPIYYNSVTHDAFNSDIIDFFGFQVPNSVLYSYSLSFSFLFIAAILPLLSGIADYGGMKKTFMKMFTYIGSAACLSMFFFDGDNVEFGILCSVVASIGYSGALVFYNSFLPEIASFDKYDQVSAKGYAFGYVGSILLLIFNLLMIQKPELFGITDSLMPAKISFVTVGIWWLGFSQITFSRLPGNVFGRKSGDRILVKGYNEVRKVWNSLTEEPVLKKFLLAFFFYNTGVQTVMYLAATFGDKELKLSGDKLIITVLIIQLVAVAGSYLFAFLSKKRGNKASLLVMIFIWIFICLSAYYVNSEFQFYALAFVVGMVMGGIQALSRATYSKLIPEKTIDHASYFSFYDVTYNISIVVGTFSYGLIEHLTGSMRNSAVSLTLFFIVGMMFLLLIKIPIRKSTQSNKTKLPELVDI